jgi:dihydrofolate reductase
MRLSLIAAVADNGVIGAQNDIPWRLPEDWRRFKATTLGHHLLMGRLTWESIGKPLPGRTTVVISRGRPQLPDGVQLAGSLEEAISISEQAGDEEAFVAGGVAIYRLALPRAERLYLTRVHASIEGDTLFPFWDEAEWALVSEEHRPADEHHAWPFSFQIFDRR